MPATEFADWLALQQDEPFLPQRADWHTAMLAFLIRQGLGDKQAKIKDFMIFGPSETESEGVEGPSPAKVAAQVHNAMMQASSRLKMRVIKRK